MKRLLLAIVAGTTVMLQAAHSVHGGVAADVPAQRGLAAARSDVYHVAIFHFAAEHVADAAPALRELAGMARREPGNLGYDVYRGKEDAHAFYVVEHWASPAVLTAHEHSDAFIRLGQGVLTRYATLHDTVTAEAFDVAKP